MKARGANRIRYPGSPGRKRCGLGVGPATSRPGAEAKALSPPPGKYGRKAEKLATADVSSVYLKELAGEHHKA